MTDTLTLSRREVLAAEYWRLIRIGNRAEAKDVSAEARRLVNDILRKGNK